MSYAFDGSNDSLRGSLTSTYSDPCTLACYIKVVAHPLAVDYFVNLGATINAIEDSFALRSSATDDQWRAVSIAAGGATADGQISTTNVDGLWTPYVGKFTADNSRTIYFSTFATNSTNTDTQAVGAVQHISIGENLAGGGDLGAANPNQSLVAEVAFWNSALSDADILAYMTGTAASQIAAANLIGYWPLSADGVLTNEGLDSGGDLTAAGAVFNADHPTITIPGASTRRRRMGLMGIG